MCDISCFCVFIQQGELSAAQAVESSSQCGAEAVASEDLLPPNASTQQQARVYTYIYTCANNVYTYRTYI